MAMTNAGMLSNGNGIPLDREKGRSLLESAAASDDGFALLALGRTYRDGWGVEYDQVKAIGYFTKAATTVAAPEANLAIAFLSGYGAYSLSGKELAKICQKAANVGQRFALPHCWNFDVGKGYVNQVRASWDFAVSIPPWSYGLNLSKGYIGEFFTDSEADLRRVLRDERQSLKKNFAIDVDQKLSELKRTCLGWN